MDSPSKPVSPLSKTPNASLNSSHEPRALATASSAEIRKDVERAMGKLTPSDPQTQKHAADTTQEVQCEVLDAVDDDQAGGVQMADIVQQTGDRVVELTSNLATRTVNAAENKVRSMQSRIDTARHTANDYIHEDPVRAVTYTAIGSAVLTAALIGIFRRR